MLIQEDYHVLQIEVML